METFKGSWQPFDAQLKHILTDGVCQHALPNSEIKTTGFYPIHFAVGMHALVLFIYLTKNIGVLYYFAVILL